MVKIIRPQKGLWLGRDSGSAPCFMGKNWVFGRSGGGNKRTGESIQKSIVVEDGVWIGANATILSGVTIAKGCVIGAGSLVNKSTEPDGVYVGCPAKRIKDLEV